MNIFIQLEEWGISLNPKKLRHEEVYNHLSHELRTPLTNINGYLEALHSGVITGTKDIYESLLEESERLIKMVEQILYVEK